MKHILKKIESIAADAWIFPVWKDEKDTREKKNIAQQFSIAADAAYVLGCIKKSNGDYLDVSCAILPSDLKTRVWCIGLGEKKICTVRKLRTAVRKAVVQAKAQKATSIAFCIDDLAFGTVLLDRIAELLAVQCELAQYDFSNYKEKSKDKARRIESIFYCKEYADGEGAVKKALTIGAVIGAHTNAARDLANTPGGDMTPKLLAQSAVAKGKKYGYKTAVFGEKEMKKIGMGGILGVSRGSVEEAQFIVMEYRHGPALQKPIVFVGKGVTFDSGGLHLKPGRSMNEMHLDMSGGAAVIGALGAIAQLKLSVNVIGVVPAVENMPSGQSYRPGDILTSLLGKTIEVESSDAEGRVVLADALTYSEKFNPSIVVDVATLTGACSIALGYHAIGLLTPHDAFAQFLSDMGEESGEYVWRLPLWEEYEADVKGVFADLVNAPKDREAGTIHGGMFLYQFAKKFPVWAHLDIASTITPGSDMYLAKGASGSGVRLLVEIARSIKKFYNEPEESNV